MMRTKITSDILQKSGLIAVEAGYTELYINNEFRGFYDLIFFFFFFIF